MTDDDRAQVMVTARLLRATATLQWLAAGLTLLAVTTLVYDRGDIAPLAAILLGLVALYYAFRVSFDARLFDDIAAERLTTAQLDAALRAFGRTAEERSWADRCRGARGLVARLALFTLAQLLAVVWIRWS